MLPWAAFESFRRLAAVPCIWRRRLGESFDVFAPRFLRATRITSGSYPCPHGCGCAHEVIRQNADDFLGVCRCESWCCDNLPLTTADILLWELSWAKLGQALCQALTLQTRNVEVGLEATHQIGAWSTQAVPVILTIQNTRLDFNRVVADLVARLRERFILLAPSSRHLDATSQELLTNAGAGFFPLASCLRLGPQGAFQSARAPGELFSRFSAPSGPDMPEDIARRAFALVEQLDSDRPLKSPTVLTVFRLYCIEELSAAQIARRTHVSKATVIRRLGMIHSKTGIDPRDLRRVSTHLDKIEEDLADSRAEHIHPQRLIYDNEDL